MTVKTKIIRIGNSQGIRIPKTLLDQLGFAKEVELEVETGRLIVRSSQQPRSEWERAFARMAQAGDDQLPDDELVLTEWEAREWEW